MTSSILIAQNSGKVTGTTTPTQWTAKGDTVSLKGGYNKLDLLNKTLLNVKLNPVANRASLPTLSINDKNSMQTTLDSQKLFLWTGTQWKEVSGSSDTSSKNFKYTKEWHVSSQDGNDSNNGSYSAPFKTIAYALTKIGNTGEALFIHNGTYTENITFSKLNVDIIGSNYGGTSFLNGKWTFTSASSSVRLRNLYFTDSVILSGNTNLYFRDCNMTLVFTKSGNGYLEVYNSDFGFPASINIKGAGTSIFEQGKQGLIKVSKTTATVLVRNSLSALVNSVDSGTLAISGSSVYSLGEALPAVTSLVNGIVQIENSYLLTPTNKKARIYANGFHSINNTSFDETTSILSDAYNLDVEKTFDRARVNGKFSAQSLYIPYVDNHQKPYLKGVIVEKDGVLYKSNDTIPFNTTFAEGTTGATWTKLSGTAEIGKFFEAGADIDSNKAVRLLPNGLVYPMDYTYDGLYAQGTFGTDTSNQIHDIAFVSQTNQILAVGTISNKPNLYVGTINGTTKTISWTSALQLSTTDVDQYSKMSIVYDSTLNKAFLAYPQASTLVPRLISIIRTNNTYAVGSDINLASGVSTTEVHTSSDGTYFYLSTRLTSTSAIVVRRIDGTLTTLVTSPSMPGGTTVHDMKWYKTNRVNVLAYSGGSIYCNSWNIATNTWNASNTGVTTTTVLFNPVIRLFNATTANIFNIIALGDNVGYAIQYNFQSDNSTANLLQQQLYSGGTSADFKDAWALDNYNAMYSYSSNSSNFVVRYNYGLMISQPTQTQTFYGNVAEGGYIKYGNDYYGVGYSSTANPNLYWNSIGIQNILDYPIIGVAQESGFIYDTIKLAVEGEIANKYSGLTPSLRYYADVSGNPTTTETDDLLGIALSESEINLQFSSATKPKTSVAVIDNTLTDPSLITEIGRYIVPDTLTVGEFIGNEKKYADFDGATFTYLTPINQDRVTILTGTNAGQVWLYDTSKWVLKTQTTSLPISNWSFIKSYNISDLVIYNNTLFQANANIDDSTAFTIGSTGKTWKQVGMYSSMDYMQNVSTATSNLTLTTSWQDVVNIVIPSSGYYNIFGDCQFSLASNQTASIRLLKNSSILTNRFTSAYIFGKSASLTTHNTCNEMYIQLNAGDTIKLQAYSAFISSGGGVVIRNNSNNAPRLNAIKVAGYLPTTGNASETLLVTRTGTNQTIGTTPATIIFNNLDNGTIPYNTTTGQFTLTAGKKYELMAGVGHDGGIGSGFIDFQWYNVTTGAYIGSRGGSESLNNNTSWGIQTTAIADITPSTNTIVELRCVAKGTVGYVRRDYSWAKINQLGTTSTSQFVGVFSNEYNVANTYAKGTIVVKNSALYQANENIISNTPFVIGTVGSTWKSLSNTVSAIKNYGSTNYLEMDNIRIWVSNGGNVNLATVSGSIAVDISGFAAYQTNQTTSATGAYTLNTTGFAIFAWVLTSQGNYAQFFIHDNTNGKAYKLLYQIGGSWNNNVLQIERII